MSLQIGSRIVHYQTSTSKKEVRLILHFLILVYGQTTSHDFSMRHKIQTKAQGVDLGRISLCLHAYQRQLQGNNKA